MPPLLTKLIASSPLLLPPLKNPLPKPKSPLQRLPLPPKSPPLRRLSMLKHVQTFQTNKRGPVPL